MINNNDKIDLSNAFKDSNVKSQDEGQLPVQSFPPGTPKMIQWVIKRSGGLVKSEIQAQYILLGFAGLAIIISLFLVFGGNNGIKIKNQAPIENFGEEAGSPADITP
ncbi:MAG: hypothetical protein AAB529_01305 [Patescibacteria group bacterium]